MKEGKIWRVAELVNWTASYLSHHGLENSRLEAELLLSHTLSLSRLELYLNPNKPLSREKLSHFRKLLSKRLKRIPLQYIIGREEFFSLDFLVNEGVMIPRPETEILVEVAMAKLKGHPSSLIVDLGTGSGVIAISLAKELDCVVYAIDISPKAIAVARQNVQRHGVEEKVFLLAGDLFQPLENSGLEGKIDLVISNPPYIPTGEFSKLPPEVRYEPQIALDGGEDGLKYYRRIIPLAPFYLKEGGYLALEMGINQAERIVELVVHCGFYHDPEIKKDYAGIERILITQRR